MDRYKKYKGSGWHGENHRHSLARRGIKTSYAKKSFQPKLPEFGITNPTKGLHPKFYVPEEKQEKLISNSKNKDIDIKEEIREMRGLFDKTTTSDLQGLAMAKARKILGSLDMSDKDNRMRLMEAEDIILGYADGELDINSAKRFLLDIKGRAGKKIDYQYDISYSPVTISPSQSISESVSEPQSIYEEEISAEAPPPLFDDIQSVPHKEPYLEKGWVQRGLKKEAEIAKGVARGAGRVAKGFFGTVAEGLAVEPSNAIDAPNYAYFRPKTSPYQENFYATTLNPMQPIPPEDKEYSIVWAKRGGK
jgi:hypothetical protein